MNVPNAVHSAIRIVARRIVPYRSVAFRDVAQRIVAQLMRARADASLPSAAERSAMAHNVA